MAFESFTGLGDAAARYSRCGYALTLVRGKAASRRGWQRTKPVHPDFAAGRFEKASLDGYGIAVVLGGCEPPLAISDLDAREARAGFLELVGGRWPDTPIARTARGLHIGWLDPGGLRPQTPKGDSPTRGHDLKVGAAYCVVAPDPAAPRRRWLPGRAPWEVPAAPMPEALVRFYKERQGAYPRPDLPSGPPSPPRFTPGTDGTPFGLEKLSAEAERVRRAAPGSLNETLNLAAYICGRLVAGGHLAREAVERDLDRAARQAGHHLTNDYYDPDAELAMGRTIKSGLDAGREHPRSESECEEAGANGTTRVQVPRIVSPRIVSPRVAVPRVRMGVR
jgi:hypothetical protein